MGFIVLEFTAKESETLEFSIFYINTSDDAFWRQFSAGELLLLRLRAGFAFSELLFWEATTGETSLVLENSSLTRCELMTE